MTRKIADKSMTQWYYLARHYHRSVQMDVYCIEMAPGPSSAEQVPDRMRKGKSPIGLEERYSADIEHSTDCKLH